MPQIMSDNLLRKLGIGDRLPTNLAATEWCPRFAALVGVSGTFEQLMRNRLMMGAFRYGLFHDHRAAGDTPHDNIKSILKHWGSAPDNSEHLVDVANLAMKEFDVGYHPNKHYKEECEFPMIPILCEGYKRTGNNYNLVAIARIAYLKFDITKFVATDDADHHTELK